VNATENAREFVLPDLGEGLTEAEIARWHVAVGDRVAVDQPVVEVETAKAVVEIPTPYAGVVTRLWGEVGEVLAVGGPLLSVGPDADGDADTEAGTGGGSESGRVLVGYGTSAAGSSRRARRGGPGGPLGPGQPPEQAPPEAAGIRVISPVVRRLARRGGIDLRSVSGTGPDGLIVRADVERAAGRRTQQAGPPTAADGSVRVPLKGLRRTAAEKLTRSHREIPAATAWVDVDATGLLEAKRRLAGAAGGAARIPLLALLARICVAALRDFPELNATVDAERQEIVRFSAVGLGLAAQTDRGLVVPVVRDAHRLSLRDLAAEIERLTAAARQGRLTPAELSGSTFTLNNYGVFGVDGSAPLINHPEAAMLGVGRIIPRPWVVEGRLEVRQVAQLSCAFDHRVCDGGVAGGFLRRVADLVEEPLGLLALA
jgi:pyruvate dehydrogenase E2 component (dihydrolipoamide acetyltransferase)